MTAWNHITKIAEAVSTAGGDLWLVGGRTRDQLLDRLDTKGEALAQNETSDYDLTVFGIDSEKLSLILNSFSKTTPIAGRLVTGHPKTTVIWQQKIDGRTLEISLPRRPLPNGSTVRDFSANRLEDARCRDFTINAIYQNPLTKNYDNPLGGIEDLKHGLLRVCDENYFGSDPLRLLRAMALVSRFGLKPDSNLTVLAGRLKNSLNNTPKDRFWPEWRKWALGRTPHLGLNFLQDSGLIGHWPALAALSKTPQNPKFHPEGHVWRHTVLVVKALSRLTLPSELDRVVLFLAALLHDIGKPGVTKRIDGVWKSYGHAKAGKIIVQSFLKSIRAPLKTILPVAKLVERHMDLTFNPTPRAVRRLARRLYPETDLTHFHFLSTCDKAGRGLGPKPVINIEDFLAPLAGQPTPLQPLLKGGELLDHFAELKPGPQLGRLLKMLDEAVDDQIITTREEALLWVKQKLGSLE